MRFNRSSGILLHPTSLPGKHGIGDFGDAAYRFVDFLHKTGQRVWQVLPLGPTGYGDSPYQCFSAFAGNPLLVSLDKLAEEGFLTADDLREAPEFPAHRVDYGAVIGFKSAQLQRAYRSFDRNASGAQKHDFRSFCVHHAAWLDDYSMFMALKCAHQNSVWTSWPPHFAQHESGALENHRQAFAEERNAARFVQYAFFKQWGALKRYCRERGIQIMGDIPIFVAHDSADVWAHRELFKLDQYGRPSVVAGVPPDYFSATGQLWGNPLYRWDVIAGTGFAWWIERFRSAFSLFDIARLDHFRGFEACWEIPAGEETAMHGRWVEGPGAAFFTAMQNTLGDLSIVAENLGFITPEVQRLKSRCGFPGMAILQFAFGTDPQAPEFRPHNFERNLVVYTGTHDNDTTLGWWTGDGKSDSTRSEEDIRKEREYALDYLDSDGKQIHWDLIRAALSSIADLAIIPLQDVLGLGSEARMNLPARPTGNWGWRVTQEMLTDLICDRLKEMTTTYGRA